VKCCLYFYLNKWIENKGTFLNKTRKINIYKNHTRDILEQGITEDRDYMMC